MIMHKELWWIKTNRKWHEDCPDLSYMTYLEDNKAFEKRKSTGLSWAENKEENAQTSLNKPMKGFEISESVARWSTQNKLFRIRDPRGFVVEVPTGNIATLLKYVTVVNGVIQEDCIWARDGNNHILVSVGSPPYIETVVKEERKKEAVKLKDLKVGDVVNLSLSNIDEYVFAGKVKCTWCAVVKEAKENPRYRKYFEVYSKYIPDFDNDPIVKTYDNISEKGYRYILVRKDNKIHSFEKRLVSKTTPCYKIGDNAEIPEEFLTKEVFSKSLFVPSFIDREFTEMSGLSRYCNNYEPRYLNVMLSNIEWKENE